MRIEHDADRIWATDTTDRQLRVVCARGLDADDDRVNQRPETMQVGDPGRAVDVMGSASRRRKTTIDRLANLAYDDKIIDISYT